MAHGREAARPSAIPISGWLDVVVRIGRRFGGLHIPLLGAGIAFYALLSIFPGITAAVAIIGLIYDPSALVDNSEWLLTLLPSDAADIIASQAGKIASVGSDALSLAALVSLAIALWSASNAIGSFMEALGIIYEEPDERSFVKVKLITIGLTVAMVAVLGLTLAIVAAIPAAMALLGAREDLTDLVMLLRWPLMFAIGIGAISVLYRIGPDRRSARWRWLTPGAVLACTLWVAGSYGFSAYVQSFANYNETFGALAGAIILMTWLWLSALFVLLGALVDAETEAQTARDSTIGPDRPMGQRGAVKADTLGPRRGEGTGPDAAGGEEPDRSPAR